MHNPLLITDLDILPLETSQDGGTDPSEEVQILAASYGQGAWQLKTDLNKLNRPECP